MKTALEIATAFIEKVTRRQQYTWDGHETLAAMRAAPVSHALNPLNMVDMLERCWTMAHEYGSAEFCDEIQAAIDSYQREKAGLK